MRKNLYLLVFLYIILLFSIFANPYDYYNYNEYIIYDYLGYILVIIILSFISFKTYKIRPISLKGYMYKINKVLFFFSLLIFLSILMIMIRLNINFQNIRDIFFFDRIISDNSIFDLITIPQLFINSFLFYLLNINLYNFIIDKKSKFYFKNLIYSSFSIVFLDLSTGGRMFTFYVIVILFIQIISFSKVSLQKINKKIFRIFTFSFGALLIMSVLRSNSFLEFLYKYMVGPSFLYSFSISDPESLLNSLEFDQFGYSIMSLNWIIIGFLKLLNFDLETLFSTANNFLTYGYFLNNEGGINAYFTGHMYFYKDYGVFSNLFILLFVSISIYFLRKRKLINIICIYFLFFLILMIRENILNAPFYLFSLIFTIYGLGVKEKIN